MNTNVTPAHPVPLCWCEKPATLRNEATDATAAHLACDEHAKDTGFTFLADQPFQYLAVGYEGNHVAQENGTTVCGLEAELELDLHGEPCLVALDADAVRCEVCSPFATRVWARWQLVQQEDREAAAQAYGPQLDGADLEVAMDEYEPQADAQAAMVRALHDILAALHREDQLTLDEHDARQEDLALWIETVYGLEADSEDWSPVWSEEHRVVGVKVLLAGIEVRYELSAVDRH